MNELHLLDPSACQHLAMALTHFLWQGVVVAALAAVLAALLRRGPAQGRYAVHLAALLLMAACLPVTYVVIAAASPAPGEAVSDGSQPSNATAGIASADRRLTSPPPPPPARALGPPAVDDVAARTTQFDSMSWQAVSPYVVAAYLLGMALMLLRVVASLYGGQRLRRDAVAVDDPQLLEAIRQAARRIGLGRAPLVAFCRRVSGPVVIGVARPVVLLPLSLLSGLAPHEMEAVLAHELAHLRRYDHWALMLQRLIEAVLFFHPAVWYVSRCLSVERENCCDDAVIAAGEPREAYAELLLKLAEQRLLVRSATALAASGARPSRLRRRIIRLLAPAGEPAVRLGRAGTWALIGLLAALTLSPALSWLLAQTDGQKPTADPNAGQQGSAGQGAAGQGESPAKPPQQLARITRPPSQTGKIVWGEPQGGLAVGIGEVRTSLQSPLRPVIEAYLENRGETALDGIILSRARFVLELDNKYYVEADFGGPSGPIQPGKRYGPVVITTDHFNQIQRLEAASVIDQTTPGPELTSGSHTLRLHCKRYRDEGGDELIASGAVKFDVAREPYPLDRAVAELVAQLRQSDRDVRRSAALAAKRLRLPGCRDALVEALKDEDKVIRRYAAEALGELADAAAIEPLRGLLKDAEMDVRLAGAESLVKLGVPLDTDWVEPIIKSKHIVFQNAIWLVRRHGGQQAAPTLARCLDFDDPSVNSYYNYTLVWQIHACGGPGLKYHHDFDAEGTAEQVEENRQVLAKLRGWLQEQEQPRRDGAAAGAALPTGPSELLAQYLRADAEDGGQRANVIATLGKAQVVTLHYERAEPTIDPAEDSAFALSLKASHVVPISHRKGRLQGPIYPQIQLVFSRFFGEAPDMTADQWLQQMKRPIAAGYELQSANVVLTPARQVMQESFERSQSVTSSLARRLEEIRADFGQLDGLTGQAVRPGSWQDGAWPRYPGLVYQHDVGPENKFGREKLSDNWCALHFGFSPISGNPRQRPNPSRRYPRQGIEAGWFIESGSQRLNKLFGEMVAESLRELDAVEAELLKNPFPSGMPRRDDN